MRWLSLGSSMLMLAHHSHHSHFLVKSFLVSFYRQLAIFIWSHWLGLIPLNFFICKYGHLAVIYMIITIYVEIYSQNLAEKSENICKGIWAQTPGLHHNQAK